MSTVRYFAAAKAAAGVAEDAVPSGTLADVLAVVRAGRDARFAQVLSCCAFLVDGDPVGARPHRTVLVRDASVVECLPPFAGG